MATTIHLLSNALIWVMFDLKLVIRVDININLKGEKVEGCGKNITDICSNINKCIFSIIIVSYKLESYPKH